MKWIKKWKVLRSTGDGYWIISVTKDGLWGCSCPVWKFKRHECKHITLVKRGGGERLEEI